MAYIPNTAFETRITNGRYDETVNITGKYQESATDVICSAGMLCKRAGLLDCEGFTAQSIKNENAYIMNQAESTDDANEVIYASNSYDWNLVSDPVSGGNFAIGCDTLGLPIPAGRLGTFTEIQFDGKSLYRFGAGNVSGSVSTNKFFTIDDGLLKPAASAPATNGALYFKLVGTGTFTVGTSVGATYYDVIACTAVA